MIAQPPRELLDRLPPQDREAESQVLGAMLRDPEIVPEVTAKLQPTDFYHYHSQRIFEAIAGLHAARKPVELVTVFQWIDNAGHAADVGGAKGLADLWEAVPTAVTWEYYASQVRLKAAARALIHAGTEMIRDCYLPDADVVEIAARIAQSADVAVADRTATDPVLIEVAVAEGVEAYRAIHRRDGRQLRAGWQAINELIPSLEPGQLIIVGARPSVGKTALGIGMALNAAYLQDVPALFVSLEMPRVEIGQRVAVAMTDANGHALRSGWATAAELANVGRATEMNAGTKLYVDDTAGQRVNSIAATCRRLKRRVGIGLIVVDYLQLVGADDRRVDRRIQVEQISRDLKRMARELAVPVVAMAQLNREVETRGDGKPKLSDLREGGGIEQDADVAILLWRHPNQDADAKLWRIGVNVAKQRNGPTGETTLDYDRAAMRFQDCPPEVPM